MPHEYRDAVVLIRKSRDGTISRVNAIVLASRIQPANVKKAQALRDHQGVLPEGEYLDLAFPREGPEPKVWNPDETFQRAMCVPPWKADANIGWQSLVEHLGLH